MTDLSKADPRVVLKARGWTDAEVEELCAPALSPEQAALADAFRRDVLLPPIREARKRGILGGVKEEQE